MFNPHDVSRWDDGSEDEMDSDIRVREVSLDQRRDAAGRLGTNNDADEVSHWNVPSAAGCPADRTCSLTEGRPWGRWTVGGWRSGSRRRAGRARPASWAALQAAPPRLLATARRRQAVVPSKSRVRRRRQAPALAGGRRLRRRRACSPRSPAGVPSLRTRRFRV